MDITMKYSFFVPKNSDLYSNKPIFIYKKHLHF